MSFLTFLKRHKGTHKMSKKKCINFILGSMYVSV